MSVGVRVAPALLIFASLGCCQLTGNYGGGPCPRSRPRPTPEEPARGFVVTLSRPCEAELELWFGYEKHRLPLEREGFEVLRGSLYAVELGRSSMVPSKGVTVWAHAPGAAAFYPYPHALTLGRTTHIEVPCSV